MGALPVHLSSELSRSKRAALIALPSAAVWVAADRLPELAAVHPGVSTATVRLDVPPSRLKPWTRETATVELVRCRLSLVGPLTASALAASLAIDRADADAALLALESEGVVLRGRFSGVADVEWCDRRLLARIHRYTLNRLRAEIEPTTVAEFQRFLFAWHGLSQPHQLSGIDGLRSVLSVLDGIELPARAWERAVLPARLDRYDPSWLDMLCLTGETAWARLSKLGPLSPSGSLKAGESQTLRTALFPRGHAAAWHTLRAQNASEVEACEARLADASRQVLRTLRARGPVFLAELVRACALDRQTVHTAIAELAAAGLATSDGFAGARAVIRTLRRQPVVASARPDGSGRWSAVSFALSDADREAAIETQARALLTRYGVVFRRMLERETNAAPWRSLAAVYRRLEARGEIRGGRFVTGVSGEQFALPEAVERLREVRRSGRDGRLTTISAVDPLNLSGVLTAGDRIRATISTRLVYCDGVALAVLEGDYVRPLAEIDPSVAGGLATALTGRPLPLVTSGFVGR
jgi:ATP-dependent Lhr-like helicase